MGSLVNELGAAFKSKGLIFILAIPPPVYQVTLSKFIPRHEQLNIM